MMRHVEIEIPDRDVADLAALLVRISDPPDGSPVDLQEVLETLVSDLALVTRRPWSEEGANMARVLRGHGWLRED